MEPRTAAQRQEDLDAFLTSVESKLRGPFSSLDLAKAITTTALRGSLSPKEYLQMIAQVLSRTEKVIQLRVLIAMLGLDPTTTLNNHIKNDSNNEEEEDMDDQIYQLLTQAQESPAYEEWVRTVAGLVRGIMFTEANHSNDDSDNHDHPKEEDDDDDDNTLHSPCRGEEAQSVLDKTCQEIIKHVQELEESTRRKVEEEQASSLWMADREPMFAPYRYSLVNPDLLAQVLPECFGTTTTTTTMSNDSYFQVRREAAILSQDQEMETQKAQEESKTLMARAISTSNSATTSSSTDAAVSAAAKKVNDTVAFPGFRTSNAASANNNNKSKVPPAKTSMFLPTKRPGVGGAMARAMPGKATVLHARKAGAAQSLVAKSRRPGGMMNASGASLSLAAATNNKNNNNATASGTSGASLTMAAGRARVANQGQARSKMQIIDVKEVEGLNKEHEEREKTETKEQKLNARKRKIMEAAAEKGLVMATGKKTKVHGDDKSQATAASKPSKTKTATPATTPSPAPTGQRPATEQQPAAPTQTNPVTASATAAGGTLAQAQAVLLAYQQKVSDGQVNTAAAATATPQAAKPAPAAPSLIANTPAPHTPSITTAPTNAIPPDLRGLLDRANKLAPEDRLRVEQFFKERFNPTPGVMVYRMKLHENRNTDPESGQAVKETFYLELDYNTFETKQLRKVKRK